VSFLESVQCYGCGATGGVPFVEAEDDLTGKPGRFTFVRCGRCGLAFQNPRVSIDRIRDYYDDEYIAHRRTNWGLLNKAFDRAMDRLDAAKHRIVARYATLGPESAVLDVGCGAGSFLQRIRKHQGSAVTGVDFKDLSTHQGL